MRGIGTCLSFISMFLFTFFIGGCVLNESVCGDGKAEGAEACDGIDLRGQTCATQGHDGGRLQCTATCTLNASECHACGNPDPCTDRSCGGHGTCRLLNCQPKCDCDEGFIAAADLTCLPAGSCGQYGAACTNDLQCCHGICFADPENGATCARPGCLLDSDCTWHGEGDHTGCCVEIPYDIPPFERGDKVCAWSNIDGGACGDRQGLCGTNCMSGLTSDCQAGTPCVNWGMGDPHGFCSPYCDTDADCSGCAWEDFPGTEFQCLPIHTGDKTCQPVIYCDGTSDCPADLVCSFRREQGAYVGVCALAGAVEAGASCDQFRSNEVPWAERCASLWCADYHCSEWCTQDCECPDGMSCFQDRQTGINTCQWSPGSGADCARDADCPDGEVCALLGDMQRRLHARCRTRECNPACDDCLGIGQRCGADQPPCYNGTCRMWQGQLHCWGACASNGDCPQGMVCTPEGLDPGTYDGGCRPFDGSATPCQRDADCPAEEFCTYYEGPDGTESACAAPVGEGLLGDTCSEDEDCASNMCMAYPPPAFCTAICLEDEDCGEDMICCLLTNHCTRAGSPWPLAP